MGSFECIMNNEQFEYETRLNPRALPRQLYVKPSSFLSLGVQLYRPHCNHDEKKNHKRAIKVNKYTNEKRE